MGNRAFSVKQFEGIEPCPKCANREHFIGESQQVAEDCCDVWVRCICGFDPTAENTGHRLEDVWGSLDPETLTSALLNCWNEPLREASAVSEEPQS